jgi:hypothetical protein
MNALPEWLRKNLQEAERMRFNNDPANRRTVAVYDEAVGELVPDVEPKPREQP